MNHQPTTLPLPVLRESRLISEIPSSLALPPEEVQVWRLELDSSGISPSELLPILAEDELARMRRFRFDSDRSTFILSRGLLRRLLAAYLGETPQTVRFAYSEYGRPLLMEPEPGSGLEFNVSHSGDVILWAFARGRRVGVDVERVRHDFSTLEIAERFFSDAEREVLRHQSHDDRHKSFFCCWTRKEAFIKAIGEGLSHPLSQFDVTLAPGDAAKLLTTRPRADDAKNWHMWDLAVPSGYEAALIAELRANDPI